MKKPYRIAIEGIDGSGKSTIIRRMMELIPDHNKEMLVMKCPGYHETPNAPLQELSSTLYDFSMAADELNCYECKAMALFLQMTLFGSLEHFFSETLKPDILVFERHSIISGLAYGPFYAQAINPPVDQATFEPLLKKRLPAFANGDFEQVFRWIRLESVRLKRPLSFWEYDRYFKEVFSQGGESMVEAMEKWYNTTLPDAVILLDLPAATASARVQEREDGGTIELHEASDTLSLLRERYFKTLNFLNKAYPHIKTHVVQAGETKDADEILSAIIETL